MQLYRMHHSGKNLEIPQCIFYGVGVRLLVVGQWPACLEHLPFQHNFPHDNFGRPKNMALGGWGWWGWGHVLPLFPVISSFCWLLVHPS